MNATRLLEHFDRLAEAPGAIPRLRRFVLDLAVRGKLVPQDANDEPAGELLKRIQLEKARLLREGKFRRLDPQAPIEADVLPFALPPDWQWARLAALSRRIHYGYTASASRTISDIRMLRITDIQNNFVNWPSVPGCEISAEDVEQYRLENGDILIARTGGTIGKTYLVWAIPVNAVFASYLIRIQLSTELDCHYLKLFMESSTYWKQLDDGSRGGGQPNVKAGIGRPGLGTFKVILVGKSPECLQFT